MPKYEQTAAILDTVNAGDDINDQMIRIIDGNERNPIVQVTAKKVLPMEGSDRPEYLQLDGARGIRLVQKNTTNTTLYEHEKITFTAGTASTTTRIDVNIPPQ